MKKVLFIALFFLTGCTSESTVNYDVESDIIEMLEIMKDMDSRIEDMESKIDDLEYQNEEITSNYQDLLFELEYIQTEASTVDYSPPAFKESNKEKSNDGLWDYNLGGTDRDADNDGIWDYDKGGTDRDMDNDGIWDYDKGGTDRDIK